MNCPKCNSGKISAISTSYPRSFECKDCGHTFLQMPRALIDE